MELKQFGEELRALRKEAQWSQEGLIDLLDQLAQSAPASEYRVIDATLLSRWEHARSQKGRQWRPTRTYMLFLIQLFAPFLDLARAQQWAAHAGYQISIGELKAWIAPSDSIEQRSIEVAEAKPGASNTLLAFPHNLPISLTAFVGRGDEIARITGYFTTATTRLITVVGEGGVGKTRLALQVAQTLVNERRGPFPDGVYFVSLAGVSTGNAMASEVATELGFVLAGSTDPEQQLLSHLRELQCLLVLDNFEHLVATVSPFVTSILQAAPGVYILVTSRIRLNLAEEWLVTLGGLSFPKIGGAKGHNTLSRVGGDSAGHTLSRFEIPVGGSASLPPKSLAEDYEAVRLFVSRARQIDAKSVHDTDPLQGAAIARICGLLQGIPLGIEMAAAWVKMLSCTEIANQIARNLDFLTSPHRNVPERHRSMRAVFEHSWRLLPEHERTVLAALSIFRGSFTYEAAVSVTGASLLPLRYLMDKSLLNFADGRYELHELLRQYAEEQLNLDDGQYGAVATKHCAYYLNFVAAREALLASRESRESVDEISAEFNNIHHAWRWAALHLEVGLIEIGHYALWRYYFSYGNLREGERFFGLVIDHFLAVGTSSFQKPLKRLLLAKLIAMCAVLLQRQGEYQQSLDRAQEATTIIDEHIEEMGVDAATLVVKAFTNWSLAMITMDFHEFEKAYALLKEGLEFVESRGHHAQSNALEHDIQWQLRLTLAGYYLHVDDFLSARIQVQQALKLCQSSGDMRGLQTCLGYLGWAELHASNLANARRALEEALPLSRGYLFDEAANLIELGETVRRQGEYGLAIRYLEQGWLIADTIKATWYSNHAINQCVLLYVHLGAFQKAGEWASRWQGSEGEINHTMAQALLVYHQADYRKALALAIQIKQAKIDGIHTVIKGKAMVVAGHIEASSQRWTDAIDAYTKALTYFSALGVNALAVEAHAGLADVALNLGDTEAAMREVETILPILADSSYVGIDEPFFTYWVCYRALTKLQDRRAAPLLARAFSQLQRYADQIGDETHRQTFWENVAVHRQLRAAYLQVAS